MMHRWARLGSGILFALLTTTSPGCSFGPRMQSFDVTVDPQIVHKAGVPASVEVDLVGVGDSALSEWMGYPVNKYWAPRDPLRKDAKAYIMNFSTADAKPAKLDRKDPVWEQWRKRGATNLIIVAFLPSIGDPAGGVQDPRRVSLPLDGKKWDGKREIRLVLSETGIKSAVMPVEP